MNIGVLGGGQLALMLAQAAKQLNHNVIIWDPNKTACAQHCGRFINAAFSDTNALKSFLENVDVVTWEFENLPLKIIEKIEQKVPLYPAFSLLKIKRDRLTEKQHFMELNIPVAPFYPVNTHCEIQKFPVLLKKRFDGYDGKGQYLLKTASDLKKISHLITPNTFIAETVIPFDTELSIIGTRDSKGKIITYDLVQNTHCHGILHTSTVIPNSPYYTQAKSYLSQLMTHHQYVGTLAIELFLVKNKLIINECAPRVHNTGHWTIEGAKTSQFENHIRAITNHTLGPTTTKKYPAMINIIGTSISKSDNEPDTYLHHYGKEKKPGRKLGHITIVPNSNLRRNELLIKYQKASFVL